MTISPTLRRHLISAGITFVANFGLALAFALSTLPPEQALTGSVIWGLINVGIRQALKVTVEATIPRSY